MRYDTLTLNQDNQVIRNLVWMMLTQQRSGITEYRRVKVEEPEFSYTQPDQSQPYRDDVEYMDIFTEGDEIVGGLEKMTGTKQMVTKDGTVIDVSAEGKLVDKEFQKKIYKDLEGEEAIIPEPEGVGISKEREMSMEKNSLTKLLKE